VRTIFLLEDWAARVFPALATAKSLPELKTLRDKVEAISHYARQQQYGLEIANDAVEIRLMAERRLGELLKDMDKQHGARGRRAELHDVTPPVLEDLGISKIQSHRWQQEAALPEDAFQTYVANARARGDELTSPPRPASATPRNASWRVSSASVTGPSVTGSPGSTST
jgi:hypothetical protein